MPQFYNCNIYFDGYVDFLIIVISICLIWMTFWFTVLKRERR